MVCLAAKNQHYDARGTAHNGYQPETHRQPLAEVKNPAMTGPRMGSRRVTADTPARYLPCPSSDTISAIDAPALVTPQEPKQPWKKRKVRRAPRDGARAQAKVNAMKPMFAIW